MSDPDTRLLTGTDGLKRCRWAFNHPLLLDYHDTEWGRLVDDEQMLYERLALKGFQAGLSCLIVLRKRPALRRAFGGFAPEAVARLGSDDLDLIAQDVGVIRNRAKIEAARTNAAATLALRQRGGLESLVWSHHGRAGSDPDDPRQSFAARGLAGDLRRHGYCFVGPTSVHAFMQAVGALPAHALGCEALAAGRRDEATLD